MKLQVVTTRNDFYGFSKIAKIAEQVDSLSQDAVELDFCYCGFFEANMVAPLYSVIARLRSRLNDVSVCNIADNISVILRKNHFLTIFNQNPEPDTYQSTLPFKIFKLNANEQFYEYLQSYMKGRGIPRMTPALSKRFRQSLLEIFSNATIHSKSDSGVFACGQFYPTKHRLDFTFADAGVGIVENVRDYTQKYDLNSCDAIRWALAEGHTTKKGQQPGGLGLKLIEEFVKVNGGRMQIVSDTGFYELSQDGVILKEMPNAFPGTCVNLEINTEDTNSYCLQSEINNSSIF
jgi:hypothetical protein